MPTPVGHSIIGLGVALACSPGRRLRDIVADRGTLILVLVLANLADVDLLVGLLVYGHAARYHGLFMHSVFFAVVVAGLVMLLPRPAVPAWRWFVLALALLLSHPAADMLQSPWGAGFFGGLGVRVLTPVSDTRWSFPVSLFLGVEYQTLRQLLSVRSAVIVLLELSCLLPLLLLVDALRGRATTKGQPISSVRHPHPDPLPLRGRGSRFDPLAPGGERDRVRGRIGRGTRVRE